MDFLRKPFKISLQYLFAIGGATLGWRGNLGLLWWGNPYIAATCLIINIMLTIGGLYHLALPITLRSVLNIFALTSLLLVPASHAILPFCLTAFTMVPLAIRLGKSAAKIFNLLFIGETNSTYNLPSKKLIRSCLKNDYFKNNPEKLGEALALGQTKIEQKISNISVSPPSHQYVFIRNKGKHAGALITDRNNLFPNLGGT